MRGTGLFDVTMGCYDGAEVCELVGMFALSRQAAGRESLLLRVSACTRMTDWEFCESNQAVKLIGSGRVLSRYSLTLA